MKQLLTKEVDIKLLFYLTVGFILSVFGGVVFHELGHYLAIRIIGIDAEIRYMSTHFVRNENFRVISKSENLFTSSGGPFVTILTGTIGGVLLLRYSTEILKMNQLTFKYWLFVFLSLSWMRQIGYFVVAYGSFILTGNIPNGGDENIIAHLLNINTWSIISITAIIGSVIVLLVVFKFIPIRQRTTFLIASTIGSSIGCIMWFGFLGKILLP